MKQILHLSLLILFLSVISCASPALRNPAGQTDDEDQEVPQTKSSTGIENGPFDDCDQRILFSKNENFSWACTDNYVHIFPRKMVRTRGNGKLKIGSFNLYHLGDDQSRLKDYKSMALIMNQWDLVGVTEIMPLPTAFADENRKLREVLRVQGTDALPKDWRVVEPGYYKLLKALQEKDSSWSLIFQSMPEGEGGTGEMAGFFYRAKRVQPRVWNYCPPTGLTDKINPNFAGLNFACQIQVSPVQEKLMSRRAFVAMFSSGKFDFIAGVSHARFRPAEKDSLKAQQDDICPHFPAGVKCEISKDKVGRFYEIKMAADQAQMLEKYDRDVIFMGDYNLDYSTNNQYAWNASIANAQGYGVYQHANTTLSLPKQALANSYDHFILRPDSVKECDLNTVQAFDFTKIGTAEAAGILKKLDYLLNSETHAQTANDQKSFLDQQIRLVTYGKKFQARGLNDDEKAKLKADIDKSLTRLQKDKFWVLREYLSDHVPIEMSCTTKVDDD